MEHLFYWLYYFYPIMSKRIWLFNSFATGRHQLLLLQVGIYDVNWSAISIFALQFTTIFYHKILINFSYLIIHIYNIEFWFDFWFFCYLWAAICWYNTAICAIHFYGWLYLKHQWLEPDQMQRSLYIVTIKLDLIRYCKWRLIRCVN